MKYRDNSKFLGTLFYITGILGGSLALGILITTWILTPRLINYSKSLLSSSSIILKTTSEGLSVIDQSLNTIEDSLSIISSSVDSLSDSFVNLNTLSTNTGDLIGNNFVEILEDTKISLDSSSKSAKLVDEALEVLAKIPLLGLDFRPEVPLHNSLSDLSSEITILKSELVTIEGYIIEVSDGFSTLDKSTRDIDTQIISFNSEIRNAKTIIESYIDIVDQFSDKVSDIQENISIWIFLLAGVITLLMIWIFLISILPLMRGNELIVGKQHYVNIHEIRNNSSEKIKNISEGSNG